MTAGERVKEVRKSTGLTMEKFGERVGVTKVAISRIESGINGLTPQMARAISMAYGVSEEWLKTGSGPMRTITADGIAAEVAQELHLNDWGTKVLERFCRMDSAERDEFLRIMEELFGPFEEDPIEEAIQAAGRAAMEAKRAELLDKEKAEDA